MSLRDELDEIDLQILKRLQADGRITHADLGREVGLSAPSILQRIRKLEERGIITGYHAILDAAKVGFGITSLVQVSLALHESQPIERFIKAAKKIPQVLEVFHVSGDFDFLLKVVAEDMEDYQALIREKLAGLPGVGRITSCFVLGTTKRQLSLPLVD